MTPLYLGNEINFKTNFTLESSGLDLFSQSFAGLLSSELECFTTLFGMERGSSTSQKRPKGSNIKFSYLKSEQNNATQF